MRALSGARALVAWIMGVAGLLAPTVHASIVYRDIPDIHMAISGTQGDLTSDVDADADGTNDLRFHLSWATSDFLTSRAEVVRFGTNNFAGRQAFNVSGAESVQAGFVIQPNLPAPPPPDLRSWTINGLLQRTFSASDQAHGWWGGAGYMGLRFSAADGTHYGWISVNAASDHIDVFSLAYESTPDAPIAAGAVPGPGTGTVLIGSLAGAGLLRRRGLRSSGERSCVRSDVAAGRAAAGYVLRTGGSVAAGGIP